MPWSWLTHLDRAFIPVETLFHLITNTRKVSAQFNVSKIADNKRKNILQGEARMVLQIRVSTLMIPKTIDNSCRNNRIFDGLVYFGFKVLGDMQVIPNRCRSVDKILRVQCVNIMTKTNCNKRATFWMLRMASWPFVGSSPSFRCWRSLHIWMRPWIYVLWESVSEKTAWGRTKLLDLF